VPTKSKGEMMLFHSNTLRTSAW